MRGCYFGHAFGWGGWWVELFLVIMTVACIIYLATRLMGNKKGHFDRRDSLEILKRRLASGEITLEEYENIKKVL